MSENDTKSVESHLYEVSSMLQAQSDAEAKLTSEQSIAMLKNEMTKLLGQVTIEKANVSQLKTELKLIKSILADSTTLSNDLEKIKSKLQYDFSELQQAKLRIETDLKKSQNTQKTIAAEHSKILKELEMAETELKDLQVKMAIEKDHSVDLSKELNNVKIIYDRATAELNTLKQQFSELNITKQNNDQLYVSSTKSLQERLNQLQATASSFENENKSLERENSALTNSNAVLTKKIKRNGTPI